MSSEAVGEAFDIADLVYGRVVFVTGKGGVGKTSVSAALARLAAAQGRRVLLCEVDSQRSALSPLFGVDVGYEPVQAEENLWLCNIDWYNALHEWVERVVPSRRVVDLILDNRIVRLFLDATPGNREVVTLSKINWVAPEYDLIVVDLPASGHATALMHSPGRTLELFRVGPIYQRSVESQRLLHSPGTFLVLVALPEEMVVNETVETWKKLERQVPGLRVPLVVLNRSSRPSLSADERLLLQRLSDEAGDGPEAELLLAGRWESRLEVATGKAMERLEIEVPISLIDVPRLSQEKGAAHLVRNLAAALARRSRRGLR